MAQSSTILHPLDPLTPSEISLSSQLIRSNLETKTSWIFNSITLLEPPKQIILSYQEEHEIPRKSFVILIENGSGQVVEVIVNLTEKAIEDRKNVKSPNQPTLTPDDCFNSERIAKEDVNVRKRCAELGYENMELVVADPWSFGFSGETDLDGKRLVQLFMYAREFENDNHYAHPLNFVTVVDLIEEKVIRIEDLPTTPTTKTIIKKDIIIPRKPINYDEEFLGGGRDFIRKDLKPIQILSPEGPSFSVNGNEISWQKFRMRISFNYREGLVLHNVKYQDGDQMRDLLYRASLVEMVVPYGDPRPPFHRKSAFDVGDYGLGFCTNSLELGCDCLGTIKYFDGVLNNHNGEPMIIKNAICLHEEDAGLLFKHTEYRNGRATVTRSRRLILSFIVTVVNYEYALYWAFNQDGSITFEIKPTGELSTDLLTSYEEDDGRNRIYGTVVAPNVNAQFHQHIFAVRLDTMFDGIENTVSSVEVKALPEKFGSNENPFGQGFILEEKVFKTTDDVKSEAKKLVNVVNKSSTNFWKICNAASINKITNKPCGWKLVPLNSQILLSQEESFIAKRAQFATRSLWVTKYNEMERFPAGFYVNQCKGDDGIHQWTKESKNIENEDIVLWHVLGVTHIPRVEDFPIMSAESCGFALAPYNFFSENPALDVPRPNRQENQSKTTEGCNNCA